MPFITCDTPEDPSEKRLTMKQLQTALAGKLQGRPDHKTLYRWLALPYHLPYKQTHPGANKTFLLSHVLAWLDDSNAYWKGRIPKAS